MKKIAYLSLAVFSLVAVSCKKEYSCDCTYKSTQTMVDQDGDPLMEPQTSTTTGSTKIKDKEDEAKIKCEGSNGDAVSSASSGGITSKQTVTTSCSLN